MKAAGLLQKRRVRSAELYQAARLFELLPSTPNGLWQADVTYIHIPGHGIRDRLTRLRGNSKAKSLDSRLRGNDEQASVPSFPRRRESRGRYPNTDAGHGWWYAVTVTDYYSRYLLACHFTPSYRATHVKAAFDAARAEAERLHGALAESPFLVTDNGSSFLAREFRRHIDGDYAHVRIGYRTPTQLGLLERFHQTLKSEEVYWKLYACPGEARESLEVFRRYNEVRPHWALVPPEGGDPVTPGDVYVHGQAVGLPRWQDGAKAARQKLNAIVEDTHFPSPDEPSEVAA